MKYNIQLIYWNIKIIRADKNFKVLNKYFKHVETNIVICLTNKIEPVNRLCFYVLFQLFNYLLKNIIKTSLLLVP